MWANYHWCIERILPVAVEYNVRMALHPDDPPVPSLGGCDLFITNECHSGGVHIEHGDIEGGAGPAICVKNATKVNDEGKRFVTDMPTTIEKVWIENFAPTDVAVLDATCATMQRVKGVAD